MAALSVRMVASFFWLVRADPEKRPPRSRVCKRGGTMRATTTLSRILRMAWSSLYSPLLGFGLTAPGRSPNL